MSFANSESNQDARPRTLKSTRAALNNVTNTSFSQDGKPGSSSARTLGKALRTARSKFQNAKAAGSLIPQARREVTQFDQPADSLSTSMISKIASSENAVELDKENLDPYATKLSSIEEEQHFTGPTSSSSEELRYSEHQTILKEEDCIQQRVSLEEEERAESQQLQQQQQETRQVIEARSDVSKKRPISTVVEQEEPKKFKVCEKGTEYEWEDLDAEDVNDPFMVSEYVNDIFEYLHKLEIMTLPNRHDLYKHSNIRQNRDILVNWMVKIHNKFGLLPETLYLALNIMDRFLCKELVQLEKLQLVGTACLFIAAKYEEVYSPSVKHFAYETDGACDEDEIREGEKFILKTLEFNLNYPNPMNFLRRISKADDYDIQSRTLAKYLLEMSVVDFRFIGILPSLCAAAAMFLSRKMLGKGKWDGNLIHYSGGYTREELAPVCNMIMDYLVQPVVHDEFFKKYASRKFMKASVISRQWAKKVVAHGYDIMTLHEVSE
ncbi:LAFE_0D05820g1_1 [Lachancea fermentati]|uniref:LAFE_0D05820g1_1 n=1 Tax=Lachancea fermentati TaxID=4955 RepID=A0A1G4MBD0_LACFM|nr:LAFE_0D05820g1_1 [Lachancea fermentati]